MKRLGLIVFLFVGVIAGIWGVVVWTESAAAAPEPVVEMAAAVSTNDVCTGNNLLVNPSFEGEYDVYVMDAPGHPDCQTWDANEPNQYCERVKLADGWHPWWLDAPRSEVWMNIQPEYVPSLPHEIPPRVHEGGKSQHYFSFWSTHEAGMVQQVAAVENGRYCFSIYGQAWSSRTTLPDFTSDPNDHGLLFQKIGIDPTGGTDWQSNTVIWSDARMQYDEFGLFTVEAVAEADTITVFTHSVAQVPVKHNDVYWDNAALSLHKSLSVKPGGIGLMVDVDEPQVVTHNLSVDITPSLSWTAVLDSSGTITPTLSTTGSSSSGTLALSFDTNGLPTGAYTTTLTISAGSSVENSPVDVPIIVHIAADVSRINFPFVVLP